MAANMYRVGGMSVYILN